MFTWYVRSTLFTKTDLTKLLFQSESDVYEKDWSKFAISWLFFAVMLTVCLAEQAYYGGNYDALLKIKNKYDPKGLLDCWKCGKIFPRRHSHPLC